MFEYSKSFLKKETHVWNSKTHSFRFNDKIKKTY